MRKIKFRLFWSYDVIKTQSWLTKMAEKGFILKRINFAFRIFYFDNGESQKLKYFLIYDKKSYGFPNHFNENIDYKEVCYSKNYYVIKTHKDSVDYNPSYNQLLSKNQKIQYITGYILLIRLILLSFIVSILLTSYLSGSLAIEYEAGGIHGPANVSELIEGIIVFTVILSYYIATIWMIYSYFKLRKTNKILNKFCGDYTNLSFTIPRDTIMDKNKLRELKKNKNVIKKTRIGWFYSPDKHEQWLESMELKGFNLLRMSKIGNSFYFIKGKPRNMKYHVDYQVKKDPTYFNINEESGWKLFFTSITRYFAISVWGQAYDQESPLYYSDQESKVKHAKKFALSYAIWLVPLGVMYLILSILSFYAFLKVEFLQTNLSIIITPIAFLVLSIEYLFFSYKIISYYFRVKKSI